MLDLIESTLIQELPWVVSCLLLWSLFGYSSILNYADDTVIAGKITNIMDHKYIAQVKKFVEWGKVNYLTLNVKKIRKAIVDFRINKLYERNVTKHFTLHL